MEVTNKTYQNDIKQIDLKEMLTDLSLGTIDMVEVSFEGEKYLLSSEAKEIFEKAIQDDAKKLIQQAISQAHGLDSISAKHINNSIQANKMEKSNSIYRTIGSILIGAVLSTIIANLDSSGSFQSSPVLIIGALVGGWLFNFKGNR